MVGRIVSKMVKYVATRFRIAYYIRRALPERTLRVMSELHYFSEHICWSYNGGYEQRFKSCTGFANEQCVIALHTLSLLAVGNYR